MKPNETETETFRPALLFDLGYWATTKHLLGLPEFGMLQRRMVGDECKVTYGYMKAPFIYLAKTLTYEEAKAKLRKLITKAEAEHAKDNARAAKEKEEEAAYAVKTEAAATAWKGLLRTVRGGLVDAVLPAALRYRALPTAALMRAGREGYFTMRLPDDLGERALLLARIDDLTPPSSTESQPNTNTQHQHENSHLLGRLL